ncbi:hypothetical protein [Bradyrhizobium sp. 166]|uniref:hypothetical protein n=1 Tax=Bradyrhizobium sp. 166 TaxID=2782638 RepID=UPI001FF742EF
MSGDKVTIVDAQIDGQNALTLENDFTWPLQPGNRSESYLTVSKQVTDYAQENSIAKAFVKESAVSGRGAATMALLQSAELRGVVMAALAAVVPTVTKSKASISKTFGERKVDDYVKDDDFWKKEVKGIALRSGSREAVMVLLSARNNQ